MNEKTHKGLEVYLSHRTQSFALRGPIVSQTSKLGEIAKVEKKWEFGPVMTPNGAADVIRGKTEIQI